MNLSNIGLVKTECFYCKKACARGYGSGGKLIELPVDEGDWPFTRHLCVVKITVPNEHDFEESGAAKTHDVRKMSDAQLTSYIERAKRTGGQEYDRAMAEAKRRVTEADKAEAERKRRAI